VENWLILWEPKLDPECKWSKNHFQRLYLHLIGKELSLTDIIESFSEYVCPPKYSKDDEEGAKGGDLPREIWSNKQSISSMLSLMYKNDLLSKKDNCYTSNLSALRESVKALYDAREGIRKIQYDLDGVISFLPRLRDAFYKLSFKTDDIPIAFHSIGTCFLMIAAENFFIKKNDSLHLLSLSPEVNTKVEVVEPQYYNPLVSQYRILFYDLVDEAINEELMPFFHFIDDLEEASRSFSFSKKNRRELKIKKELYKNFVKELEESGLAKKH
jgi:hypothetical protein